MDFDDKLKEILDGDLVSIKERVSEISDLLEENPAAFFRALTKRKQGPRRIRKLKEVMADMVIADEKRDSSLVTGMEWYRLVYKVCKSELDEG